VNGSADGPSRSSLEETFRELADEELLRRCTSGELTELAQAVAREEVRVRGLALPAPETREEAEPEYLGDWVIVARYLSYTEVHLQRAVLEGSGIPAVVADAQLMQTDGLLGPALRGASLRVPAAYADQARELLAAYRRGAFRLRDDFDPGKA
jgi:hypothetical protein